MRLKEYWGKPKDNNGIWFLFFFSGEKCSISHHYNFVAVNSQVCGNKETFDAISYIVEQRQK